MVRIKLSPSKKRYLKGKHLYGYIRGHLPVPKEILTRLEPYFKEDFQAEMTEDNVKIEITYTFFKTKNQEQNLTNRPANNSAAKNSEAKFLVLREQKCTRQNVSEPRKPLGKSRQKLTTHPKNA